MEIATLGEAWWTAFDAAASAMHAAAATLPASEIGARARRLARERESTVALLDAVACLEHDPHRFEHLLLGRSELRSLLRLPAAVKACVFDLDAIVAGGSAVHAAAWQEVFDRYLDARPVVVRFDPHRDYGAYLHGRPRLEGIHAFLASRGISLPPAEVRRLAATKQTALGRRLARHGVHAFAGSERYLELAREAGIRRAVVSASTNASAMLARAGLERFVDVRVDGTAIGDDALLAACERLAVRPQRAAAFVTTSSGIAAARAVGFALVVAVDLTQAGADREVASLAELLELSARPGSSTELGGRRAPTPIRAT
jgi:beta-phosphoglucomutase-like phosphatase (HAD superfamily)